MAKHRKITYKKAGVDISTADSLIKNISALIDTTRVKGSMDSVGGFGGFFDLKLAGERDPLLVASTDGVGTKLKIAGIASKHDTVGVDLVAMCVNDILCCGARPLFFLDYFACGKLEKKTWNNVVKGIVTGCRASDCALLGGETAEMPGMYGKGEYDLAGFCVGAVSKKNMITGEKIAPGDIVLAVASSGLHSNGFSLVRKIFTGREIKRRYRTFIRPTSIYVRPFLELRQKITIKGAAHITGGGIIDNIPRILPADAKAVINTNSWKVPSIFKEIKERAGLEEQEMYRTFNMGAGMALIVSRGDAGKAIKTLKDKFALKSWIMGEITKGKKEVELQKGVSG